MFPIKYIYFSLSLLKKLGNHALVPYNPLRSTVELCCESVNSLHVQRHGWHRVSSLESWVIHLIEGIVA